MWWAAAAPQRDQLTVTGEHDRLGRIRRHVHRDLSPTVVVEGLGDKLSRDRVDLRRFRDYIGTLPADAGSVIHAPAPRSFSWSPQRRQATSLGRREAGAVLRYRAVTKLTVFLVPMTAAADHANRADSGPVAENPRAGGVSGHSTSTSRV
jgi:hypothetical protein